MKTKLLTLIITLLCTSSMWSQDYFNYEKMLFYVTSENTVTVIGTTYGMLPQDTTITIPGIVSYNGKDYQVTQIGTNAFYAAYYLRKITLPETIEEIGNLAFAYCPSLESMILPQGLKHIHDGAFYYCTSLKTINLPDSLQEIGENTFYNCLSLHIINLPENVKYIDSSAFTNCQSLTSINISDNAPYFSTDNGVLFNKDKTTILKYPEGKTGTSFAIPQSVSTIADYAFYAASPVSIVCSEGVDSIGNFAFAYCPSLCEFTIPASAARLGNGIFSSCTQLGNIKVAAGNPNYTSENGVLLNKQRNTLICYPGGKSDSLYNIPDYITQIGYQAFWGCASLNHVNIPESVTHMGKAAFYLCKSLQTINIPNSLTSISDYAFAGCASLYAVNLPNTITDIGIYAFTECKALKSIKLPEHLTRIKECTFSYSGITSIDIPETITDIERYAFSGCDSLTYISFPEGLTRLSNGILSSCSSLDSIYIPRSVVHIESNAFSYCSSLRSITIPANVSQIDYMAFTGNQSLTFIRCEAINPPAIQKETFYDIPTDIPIYVPAESIEKYQSAEYWSAFTNYQGFLTAIPHINSAAGNITISHGTLHNPQGLKVKIYDMSGRQVYQGCDNTINMPAGIYIIRCGNHTLKATF